MPSVTDTKPEGRVVKATKDLLAKRGGIGRKTEGSMNTRGEPDLIYCYRGVFLGMEAKAPGKRTPTALQAARLAEYRVAGGIGVCFDDADQIEWILDRIDENWAPPSIHLHFDQRWPNL